MLKSRRMQRRVSIAAILTSGLLSVSMTKAPPAPQTTPPAPDQACPGSVPSQNEVDHRIDLLKATIKQAITTTSPNAAMKQYPYGSIGVFSGNFDWHSSVHAHWALLNMARVMGDNDLRDFVLNRLTPDAIANTRQILNDPQNAEFEMPYGQAWLLLLLDEVSKTPQSGRSDFVQLKQETEARLTKYLVTADYPENPKSPTLAYRYNSAHGSWLFAYWLVRKSHPSAAAQTTLDTLLTSKLEPGSALLPRYVTTIYDFLYLPAILSMIEGTDYPVTDDPGFQIKISPETSHTAGQAMVRIWPHAFQSSKEAASCARYQTRMTEMFSRPDQWQTDFLSVTHWVPQFMWMAMWLERGMP